MNSLIFLTFMNSRNFHKGIYKLKLNYNNDRIQWNFIQQN